MILLYKQLDSVISKATLRQVRSSGEHNLSVNNDNIMIRN